MNRLWYTHYRAILWKELIEGIRVSKFTFPLSVLVVLVMQLFPVVNIMRNGSIPPAYQETVATSMLLFIPVMIIPFFGNLMVFRTLYEERKNRTIPVLMASGISPSVLWSGKFTVAAVVSYVSSNIAVGGYLLFMSLYLGRAITVDSSLLVVVLLIAPVISIGVLAVLSVAYWWIRNAQFLGMVFPILSLIGVWNVSLNFSSTYSAILTSSITLLAGVVMIALSCVAIGAISKERIAAF